MLLACSQTFCFLFNYLEERKKQRLWTSLHNRRFMSQRGERGILHEAWGERGLIFFFSPRLALLAKFRS